MRTTAILITIVLSSICAKSQNISTTQNLIIGGYGEATYSYNFHSDSPYRYMYPDRYSDSDGYGRADLPHVVFMVGYDFGNGWGLGSEIEFEHGGVEASIEVEGDEAIELEHEIERGGEVYLEQFWIQKEFKPQLNIRAGMIIVPVGLTNSHHEPDGFFTVFRQEGESTIIPCTWHQIGINLWGKASDWEYQFIVIPGLNSRLFSNSRWVGNSSGSAYEFTVVNSIATAIRLDNRSIKNFKIGISGYIGGTDNDAYPRVVNASGKSNETPKGTVMIGSADYEYNNSHFVSRGNLDYGYLSNASAIGTSNKNSDNSTFSPYSHTLVGKKAWAAGIEAGIDILSFRQQIDHRRLFVFSRLEAYDSYVPASDAIDYKWSDKKRLAIGINYIPTNKLIIKTEYSLRLLDEKYNNEPSFNIGIAYSGFFTK